MDKIHTYNIAIEWTGNRGRGTSEYRGYDRDHKISAENKIIIEASSDPSFLGDRKKYNPEELFVASLSSCHMLWYLHICSDNGIVVVEYTDQAIGTMQEGKASGRFIEVVLQPLVKITDRNFIEKANQLHEEAHRNCFIANSCNFPVGHKPTCIAIDL